MFQADGQDLTWEDRVSRFDPSKVQANEVEEVYGSDGIGTAWRRLQGIDDTHELQRIPRSDRELNELTGLFTSLKRRVP